LIGKPGESGMGRPLLATLGTEYGRPNAPVARSEGRQGQE